MMKKFAAFAVLGAVFAQLVGTPALCEDKTAAYKVVSVAYESDLEVTDWEKASHTIARYADDKTPIAMSEYYGDRVFATVPAENADRPIEAFVAEEKTFTDEPKEDSEKTFEFYLIKSLSMRGIFEGDEQGRANANAALTRAEAAALLVRTFDLKQHGVPTGFDDVKTGDWFYDAVSTAANCGVVAGVGGGLFEPQRTVTREEFTAMLVNTVYYTGLRTKHIDNPKQAIIDEFATAELKDVDEISDYALEAYALLGYSNIYEVDYIDNGEDTPPTDVIYAKPKEGILRKDTAQLINGVLTTFQVYPSEVAMQYGFDKQMPVIDGSTSTYPFTQAIYSNLFSNGFAHEQMPEKNSKTHASYQRLINGEVDAIIASVYPADDIIKMAEDSGVELELTPIGYDAMVFFTNIENSVKGLTTQQISDIYVDNKYKNWKELGGPDAAFYPYCRNNDSGSHAQMQRHFLNGGEINEAITRENTSVEMASILTDVIGAKTDDPKGYALGYSIYYYYNNVDAVLDSKKYLKLLEIDGVYPDEKTIADGTYPLSNNTYVVIRKDAAEDSLARRFVEFMLSPMGQMCVDQAGFGALNQE